MRTVEESALSPWPQRWTAACAIVLVTFIAYVPAMRGGWVWDDDAYVTQNPTLTTAAGLKQIWLEPRSIPQYYPLVHTSFWIEYHLWGLNPFGYHAVNVLLHAINALLLWRILRRLNVPGAWLAACVFAVHPVHVESVAWITERKNVLSGLFYLAALWTYLQSGFGVRVSGFGSDADAENSSSALTRNPKPETRNPILYTTALVLFILALLSKTVACTFPAAALLIVWWKRGSGRMSWRRDVAPLAPMFVLGLAFGLTTAWLEKVHVGAEGKDWSLSAIDRMHLAARAAWFYLAKLLWPSRLTFVYPRWTLNPGPWWQHAFPAATAGLIAALWFWRHRVGRAPLVAVLLFGGTLLPALGLVDVYPFRYSFVADHFQYLASAGVIAAVIAAAVSAAAVLMRRVELPRVVAVGARVGAGAVLLVALATLTWRQGGAYRDAQTLWQDTLAKNPDCWMAHNNLAVCYLEKGQLDAALAHATQSLRLNGDHAEAHNALGLILARSGKTDEAAEHYRQALALKPQLASAQVNWGVLLARGGKLGEAEAHFAEAARLRPRFTDPLYNWATALSAQGKDAQAVPLLARTLEINPLHSRARLALGELLQASGDAAGAAACLAEGVRLKPDWPAGQSRLGGMLASSPDPRVRDARRGLELCESACAATRRQDPELLANLAVAYAATGRTADARQLAGEAARVAAAAGRLDLAREITQWSASPPAPSPSPQAAPSRDTVGSTAE